VNKREFREEQRKFEEQKRRSRIRHGWVMSGFSLLLAFMLYMLFSGANSG
jgi:hypothetical protein